MKKKTYILVTLVSAAVSSVHASQGTGNFDVPPKEEWKICAADNDCQVRVFDCVGVGPYVAYNKNFNEQYNHYFAEKCQEKVREGVVKVMTLRREQPPGARCIRQKCEVAPEKLPAEDKPSIFERFKSWFSDLF